MSKFFLLLLGFAAPFSSANAENKSITLRIEFRDSIGISNLESTIWIQDECGNTPIQKTNIKGKLEIQVPACKSLRISARSVLGDTAYKTVDNISDTVIYIQLKWQTIVRNIADVHISKAQPIIHNEGEKLVVDANSINPGGVATAIELLERCPGLMVDQQNNNLQMKGKSGVMIMIDGRLQPLSGADLFNLLRSIPSSMVEKIELISNPSARYDAAGNAGIINIVTRKNKKLGWSGNLLSGLGYGRYEKVNEGVSASYRNKKFATQLQYNYGVRKGFNQLYLQRDFYKNDTFSGSYKQRNYLRFPFNNHTLRTSFDYYLNSKTTLGVSLSANGNFFNPNGKNYSDIIGPENTVVSYFTTTNNSEDKWMNGSTSAYLRKSLDTLGSEFSVDADAAAYRNSTKQLFTTEYYDTNWTKFLPDYLLAGDLDGKLNILALKSDYVKKYRNKKQWETGVKASRVVADNDVKFSDQSSGISILDSAKSNHFIYTEYISAAYLQTSGDLKKLNYQIGLRGENTIANGIQKYTGAVLHRRYFQLFPSFSLSRPDKKGNSYGITVSRRINRPSYNQLNPFKFYLDPTTYKAGNPYLNPELTWSAELQWVHARGAAVSIGLNHTNRSITEVIYPSEEDARITVQTNKNLRNFRNAVASVTAPMKFTKKGSGFISVNFGYQYFTGNIGNTPLGKGSLALNGNLNQNIPLGKNWIWDISGMYQSKQLYGYLQLKALGQAGTGITRFLWDKKATLKLAFTDIFFTGNPRGVTDFVGYHEEFVVKRETRIAMLTFNYKFGKPQGPPRNRRSGAEEEKTRAAGSLG